MHAAARKKMPFWRLYDHLVWTTKNREPLIQPDVERRLFPYLVNKASELDVYVYAINGWYDHVHLIVAIPPKHAVAHVVKLLKGASTHDLNHAAGLDHHFAWQRGYGALSFGERQWPVAEAYVANQKEHHLQQTTNVGLERSDEYDEGPDVTRPDRDVVPAVHETTAPYSIANNFPF